MGQNNSRSDTTMNALFSTLLCLLWTTQIIGTGLDVTKITEAPPKNKVVLLGSDVKLVWKFVFKPVKNLRRIGIAKFEMTTRAKVMIASTNGVNSVAYNPKYDFEVRYVCDVKVDKNGVGIASFIVRNIQFNQTGSYGVVLDRKQTDETEIENFVNLKVVDMVPTDANVGPKLVKSWLGKNTSLQFDVIYRGDGAPKFEWFKKYTKEKIYDGITTTGTTSILTIVPENATYFGEYVCKARSNSRTISQSYLVLKLEYAGPPTGLEYKFHEERVVHTVVWKQAVTKQKHMAKEYKVEIWNEKTKKWQPEFTTKILSVSFSKLMSTTKIRVCSSNEIGYDDSSCTEPILLLVPDSITGKPGASAHSQRITPCIFVIFAAVFFEMLS